MVDAIAQTVSHPATNAGGVIQGAFGGPSVVKGDDLTMLMQSDCDANGDLLAAASE